MPANNALQLLVMHFAFGFPSMIAYGIGLFLGLKLREHSPRASTTVVFSMLGLITLFVLTGVVRSGITAVGSGSFGMNQMIAHQLWSLCSNALQGVAIVTLVAASFQAARAAESPSFSDD